MKEVDDFGLQPRLCLFLLVTVIKLPFLCLSFIVFKLDVIRSILGTVTIKLIKTWNSAWKIVGPQLC